MIRAFSRAALVAVLTFCLPLTAPAFADGGKAKNAVYKGMAVARNGTGTWDFTIDTSPIIFYLGTVNRKYHVLLIRAKNNASVPLKLSKNDTIELEFPGHEMIKGLLNLSSTDHATWDGLETEIRTAVAYPDVVPPGEEEGIYFYVPVEAVSAQRKAHRMPLAIHYNIKSLPDPVELHQPSLAAA